MKIPYVIDNQNYRLADVLSGLLTEHQRRSLDVATAYFTVGGFGLLQSGLLSLGNFRLLLGAEPSSGEQVGLRPEARQVRRLIRRDLELLPFSEKTLRLVEDVIAFLRQDKVLIRLHDKGFLHAKCWLFYSDRPGQQMLFDRFRPIFAIVGSSNFTAPGLTSNRELKNATISAAVLSQEELGREDLGLSGWGNEDLVLIDESHNFRNRNAQRYGNLERLLGSNGGKGRDGLRKKVILLTATPINNDLFDLYNQLCLITRGDRSYFSACGIGDLYRYFLKARRDSKTKDSAFALFNLLEEVVIPRTRPFIRKAYPEATIGGKLIHFPQRKLKTVRYDLEGTYSGIYDEVVSGVESLKLAPYNLEAYKKAGVEVDRFEEGREQALVGIFKSRYLKRFESSIPAFRISVRRALEFLKTFESYILDGRLLKSSDFHKAMQFPAREDEEDDATPTSMADDMDANEDGSVIEEQEQFTELASSEFLIQQLRNLLGAGGNEMLEPLPDGIHSGLAKTNSKGVFFYFQADEATGKKLHFWRYADLRDQTILDNRYLIANLIACEWDTPRVVEPEIFDTVFELQEKVIEDILQSVQAQRALEAAPRSTDPIQQTVATLLQNYLNHPDVDRRETIETIRSLNQPLLNIQITALRKAYKAFQGRKDIKMLLSDLAELQANSTKEDGKPGTPGVPPTSNLTRDNLRLICFDVVSGG